MCAQMSLYKFLLVTQWLLFSKATTNELIKRRSYEQKLHVVSLYEELNLEEFSSSFSGNYTTLFFMKKTLLVGARNFLLIFNTTNGLEIIKNISWIPKESILQTSCVQSGIPQDECFNFVKVLAVFDKKLLSCGTNSHYPICMWRNIENLQQLGGSSTYFGKGFVPYNPHSKSSYTFSDDGRFFSGVKMEFGGQDNAITANEFDKFKLSSQLRTLRHNHYWLDDPVFRRSFLIGDYIYFFFDEFARECSDCDAVRYSRVARICKGDTGGNDMTLWVNFVTFQKARLNCSLPGAYPFHFNILHDIHWDARTTTFYGVFTTGRSHNYYTSAICPYSLMDVDEVFTGTFKHKEDGFWKEKTNPGHINECTVNTRSLLYAPDPSEILRGRMPTRSMTSSSIYEQSQCILTTKVVQPRSIVTPFYLHDIRFIKVATISFQTNQNESREVWYIATDRGTILKLSRTPIIKEFCIFEEYEIFQNNKKEQIKAMEMSPDKESLIIGSDTKLIKLPLLRCDRYVNKRSCLEGKDPLCGWSMSEGKCNPWTKRSKIDWEQNITSCPQREAKWSEWSSWSECLRDDKNLCKCRRRTCVNARMFYNCHGADIELKNCTVDVSTLTNTEDWWRNGVVNGGWSEWSKWSDCLRGYRNRSRTCTKPLPKNGGSNCKNSNKEYTICEPVRFDDAKTFMWTSWSRVRGPEKKAIRYKISCSSRAVVMKNLQIDVLRNETVQCNKSLCIDPPTRLHRFLNNWGPWLSCKGNTTKLRTRQLCTQNLTSHWSCNQHDIERTVDLQNGRNKSSEKSTDTKVHLPTTDPLGTDWFRWSPCVCEHDVTLTSSSLGIQHRKIPQGDKTATEYRTCPCEVIQLKSTNNPGLVDVRQSLGEPSDDGEYSLTMVVIIVCTCCAACVVVTAFLLIMYHRRKERIVKQKSSNCKHISISQSDQPNGTAL